ncbi:MAG: alpha/beta fold hydrolase [Acidobacteria bacterium]|nr:alpha/beta fold hydrolase [Acidobacteriota bacterium]
MSTPVIYLHGFASSPASKKAQYFLGRFGPDRFSIPDLVGEDFFGMTITSQLRVLEGAAAGGPVDLMGSSMGGYLAALFAAANPGLVRRLVLLAPAFDFTNRWAGALGGDTVRQWRETGRMAVFHYGWKRTVEVGYGLYEDSLRYPPFPDVHQPALIFHGTRDNVIPHTLSREFARLHSQVELHEVDSDHELIDALELIWEHSEPFLR